jgi:transcriptional regulator with XRE-family HTH domain
MIKKLRLQRGWSQEHLSLLSGLSVRTIQRIEKGQKAGLESLKSLAAVFDIQLMEIQKGLEMNDEIKESVAQKKALEEVSAIKKFYTSLITYAFVISILFVINFITDASYIWAIWPALGWGIGIVFHGLKVFKTVNLFGAGWEKKQLEKRLNK